MGEGRFTDVDVVRYDFVTGAPGPPAQAADRRPVIVFLRACDLHAVKRLDQMYLGNGPVDTFYARIRDRVRFALIGCTQSFAKAPIGVSGIVPGKSVDLTIRRVGRVTNEMFDTYVGQILLLRGPYGNGFDVGRYVDGECVVVAGGAGVSPARGVIEALAQRATPRDKHVIVGFRSPDDMLFRDDLARWDKAHDLTLTVDAAPEGYEGNVGLVTKYIPELALRDPATAQAVVVGPPPMMHLTVLGLLDRGFAEKNIWVS